MYNKITLWLAHSLHPSVVKPITLNKVKRKGKDIRHKKRKTILEDYWKKKIIWQQHEKNSNKDIAKHVSLSVVFNSLDT